MANIQTQISALRDVVAVHPINSLAFLYKVASLLLVGTVQIIAYATAALLLWRTKGIGWDLIGKAVLSPFHVHKDCVLEPINAELVVWSLL